MKGDAERGRGKGGQGGVETQKRTHQEYLLDKAVLGLCRSCSCTGRTDSRHRSRKAIQLALESRCQKSDYDTSHWSHPQCLCNRIISAVIKKAAVNVV